MTGLKSRSGTVDYTPMRPPVTNMADGLKNGVVPPGSSPEVTSTKYTDPRGGGEDEHRCRWGPFSSDFCQTFRKPAWFLVCLCWAGAIQGMVVNGFVNVVISTVERRFEISSTESGIIASCYDIAAVLCLIPVSYFGGRGRKPVYLAVGMFILGIGSFVFTLPHFSTGLYQIGEAENTVCIKGGNVSSCGSSQASQLSNYKYVFYLGQLLHGVGASPLYTLGVTYLDENVPVRSSSLYTGIFYACAIFGPGIGYLAGGAFLNFFTDVDKLDEITQGIDANNPRWVGAWWIGFLISGTIAILISLPIFGFPKAMPGSEKYREEREKEVYKGKFQKADSEKQPLGLKHIVTSAKVLLTNPTFMFLNLAAASEGIVISGFSTFGPKFIEFQFGLPSSTAAQYVGLMAIPGGGGGTFVGGWLVNRFNWDVRRILKFCIAATVVTVCLGLIFLIHCPNLPFAGISNDYMQPRSTGKLLDPVNMDAACNTDCGCSLYDYNPVCGRDNVMYYSPCYAGCQASFAGEGKKHSNCSCVTYNYTAADVAAGDYWQVQEGKCENDCPYLVIFLSIFAFILFGIFITSMPALSASLRCVTQDQRSFAMGIQWIIARCLGSIPGPILFGKMLDLTCLVWQTSCQGDGTCFYYDNQRMSYNLLALGTAFNTISTIAFILALVFYRSNPTPAEVTMTPPTLDDGDISLHTSMTTITQPSTPSSEFSPGGGIAPLGEGQCDPQNLEVEPPVDSDLGRVDLTNHVELNKSNNGLEPQRIAVHL
ncbi:solute carrier organic anion transporter family member 4A1-like [Littorina saxatilis]|uniref:Solute carrier organic anion transporter family member n=1 Tax=Littorina saxatilis TaxID=31220 RepID=A0AAN9AQR9_9CAEN